MEIPDFSHLKGLLSTKELEILSLIALGLSNPEIAGRIHISTNTVKYHIKNIYLKLEVSSRAELLAREYALGL